MNFLFWNTGKGNLDNILVDLVESTRANIIVLAEYESDGHDFLRALYEHGSNYYALPTIGCTRIKVFSDIEPSHFKHKRESDRYSIREFSKPGHEQVLLALVHLPSKLYMSEHDQLQEAIYFRQDVEDTERETNNINTIIVGDFNMNPFEPGMISANALHSVPCLRTAKSRPKVLKNRQYSFFYNPTWSLFGDLNGVPGTYYLNSSSYYSLYWHMLDQVILRPNIADRFDKRSFRIISTVGDTSLLNSKGRPTISDHLPIFFTVNLSRGGGHEKPMA